MLNGPVQGTVVRVGHAVFNHEIECIVVDAQKFLVSRKAIFLFCVDVNHCVLFDLNPNRSLGRERIFRLLLAVFRLL